MFGFVVISALLVVSSASPTPPPTGAPPVAVVADEAAKTSMQTIESSHNFEETVAKLKQFIEGKGLTTFAEIDHAKGAEEAGLTLAPATVIIFGNPKAGTLLMQDDINIAVDLPLKVLVFAKDEKVMVGYRVPSLTLDHYNLISHRGILNKMDGLFKKMTEVIKTNEDAEVIKTNEGAEVAKTNEEDAEVVKTNVEDAMN